MKINLNYTAKRRKVSPIKNIHVPHINLHLSQMKKFPEQANEF
jgi:hypothetical protein